MAYQVQRGDTLADIAARFRVSLAALERANPQIRNPNVIRTGQSIHIPGSRDEFVGAAPAHGPTSFHASRGSSNIVRTAESWYNTWKRNPENGGGTWSQWCLGFVNRAWQAAGVRPYPQMYAKNAAVALNQVRGARLLNTNTRTFAGMKPGAAMFFPTGGGGHVCIYTGQRAADGSPLMVTTGNWRRAHNGIAIESLSAISRYDGRPAGWVNPP